MRQCQNVGLVLALLSLADVIHDHVSDFLHAVRLVRKVLSEGGGGDFGSSAICLSPLDQLGQFFSA